MASPLSTPAMSEDTFSSLHLGVDSHRLPVYQSLPTPTFDQAPGALLSPPLSRASSPLPPHLKVNIDLVSGPSANAINPLPSPVPDSETRQVGKKTSAFFSSPFDPHRTPSPPPSLMKRNVSRAGTSPPSPSSSSNDMVVEPERAQTANSSFFFAKGSATPTPPPSVYSPVDDSASPLHQPLKLPPLSRFFPSRASVDPNLSDDSGRASSSPPSFHTSFQRDFVTIDDLPSFASSPTDIVTPDFPTPQADVPQPTDQPQVRPLHRETVALETIELMQGITVGTDVPLQLIRQLGHGSFSCVWLALDVEHRLEHPGAGARLKSESIARKKGDRSVHGLRPPLPPSGAGNSLVRSQSVYFAAQDGEGATTYGEAEAKAEAKDTSNRNGNGGSLIAVKMIDRAACDANDRTRISFVREVEVLRHISHPSIVSYLHSFTTATHHCLVLEALHGGELFDLLDQGDNHNRMTEPLLRRMFGELCQAVGWMHGVGLVHRDLKLENILLTANPFLAPASSPITLSSLPSPLVKLTDFGLARFIDPAGPALVTRCGSESYAAPEIVTGKPYDGRQTDAWACGIVLYALATRALPFDRVGTGDRDTRRSHLMRIAQGDYVWPEPEERLATEGLKDVVARLLVRHAGKRARVVELWDAPWMRGEGAPTPPLSKAGSAPTGRLVGSDIPSVAKQEL